MDRRAIPRDAHIFRIKDWEVVLVVSESVKNAMERVGCYGAEFTELELA
ncbi:MAG TPA: double-CXXCG motif protein [Polyangium sp.]|nr:double-CXXCG motif protein [Polyangium sp.]